jgi:hypothetical protein
VSSVAAGSQHAGSPRRSPPFAAQLRRPAAGPSDSHPDALTGTSRNTSLRVARCQLVKRLFDVGLLVAVLGLLFALDMSACARYPGQQDRARALAALGLVCLVAAGRAIGVWAGLVCCRWSPVSALAFGVAQVSAAGIVVAVAADPRAWSAVARFFTADSAAALTGALAALVVVLLVGCYATRRAARSDQ